MSEHDEPEGYDGEVTVVMDGEPPRTAGAVLGARFDPLAGSVVWSGRLRLAVPPRTRLEVTTPHGTGAAEATEADPWGNTRITGVGRPPFPVELLDGAAEV
ncbi:DUF4873 domain-containing protein [Blastococcus sp. CCUG 61487]|uniref:DUF4873 domain-containing protein n=1 Tax=Blastococcus sp. CCUG 61487 TaxID=1840703 RepID=UPI0010C0F615|nr:DUF4873 domain-containing protein [Blastococcus sp. CCUG 61487]TKJ19930.1 hypothetical protein A6V29_09600 [Blastococcus sp. CCUG 61487]